METPTNRPFRRHLARLFADFPLDEAARIVGVLTDIDDTLTTAGAITPDALAALDRLKAASVPVIAVTGRPLGWSRPCLRPVDDGGWPIAAIVAENGAVALFRRIDADPPEVAYAQDEATRAANARRLRAVTQQVLADVPEATLARDSAGRVTDIAIDHAEFARLDRPAVDRVVAIMRTAGMNASVSSIHVNGWFGAHTKLSGARWAVRELLKRELDAELDRWFYIGDSANDQTMFAHVPASIGVANLLDAADTLTVWPRYLTAAPRGAGFAEVADRLLLARQRPA